MSAIGKLPVGFRKCPVCHGSGKQHNVYTGEPTLCPKCNGEGVVPEKSPTSPYRTGRYR